MGIRPSVLNAWHRVLASKINNDIFIRIANIYIRHFYKIVKTPNTVPLRGKQNGTILGEGGLGIGETNIGPKMTKLAEYYFLCRNNNYITLTLTKKQTNKNDQILLNYCPSLYCVTKLLLDKTLYRSRDTLTLCT